MQPTSATLLSLPWLRSRGAARSDPQRMCVCGVLSRHTGGTRPALPVASRARPLCVPSSSSSPSRPSRSPPRPRTPGYAPMRSAVAAGSSCCGNLVALGLLGLGPRQRQPRRLPLLPLVLLPGPQQGSRRRVRSPRPACQHLSSLRFRPAMWNGEQYWATSILDYTADVQCVARAHYRRDAHWHSQV